MQNRSEQLHIRYPGLSPEQGLSLQKNVLYDPVSSQKQRTENSISDIFKTRLALLGGSFSGKDGVFSFNNALGRRSHTISLQRDLPTLPEDLKNFQFTDEQMHILIDQGISPMAVGAFMIYPLLIERHPNLRNTSLYSATAGELPVMAHTLGVTARPHSLGEFPAIILELRTPEHFALFVNERDASIREVAEKLNVPFSFFQKHPEILAAFIIAHEFGHVAMFFEIFEGDPYQANLAKYNELKSLPIPNENPSTARKYTPIQLHTFQKPGETVTELLTRHDIAYKALPSELYPDNFAVSETQTLLSKMIL